MRWPSRSRSQTVCPAAHFSTSTSTLVPAPRRRAWPTSVARYWAALARAVSWPVAAARSRHFSEQSRSVDTYGDDTMPSPGRGSIARCIGALLVALTLWGCGSDSAVSAGPPLPTSEPVRPTATLTQPVPSTNTPASTSTVAPTAINTSTRTAVQTPAASRTATQPPLPTRTATEPEQRTVTATTIPSATPTLSGPTPTTSASA